MIPKKYFFCVIIIFYYACAVNHAICQENFKIKTIKKTNKTYYTIHHGDNAFFRLECSSALPNKTKDIVFHIDYPSHVSIEKQLIYLEALLKHYFKIEGKNENYYFRLPFYDELRPRLFAALAASPDWDQNLGKARKGSPNSIVKNIMNEQAMYIELKTFFESIGYDINLDGIEKAITYTYSIENMQKMGIIVPNGYSKNDKFPAKCIVYFKLTKRER